MIQLKMELPASEEPHFFYNQDNIFVQVLQILINIPEASSAFILIISHNNFQNIS